MALAWMEGPTINAKYMHSTFETVIRNFRVNARCMLNEKLYCFPIWFNQTVHCIGICRTYYTLP